jgi:glucose-specific phosphotransferase system IIA component
MKVFSPLTGNVVDLSQVPDEAFSQKMLGDGCAIEPLENFISAPFDSTVETLQESAHAIGLKIGDIEILIHIGVDTVNLKGDGFNALVKEGDKVVKGQKLIEFDRDFIAKNAKSALVIVIVASDPDMKIKITDEKAVKTGDFLFETL